MELAIVIAVMAMLKIGTFITAKILEHAHERSIINQLKTIEKSIFMFKTTYDAPPGDFTKANTVLPNNRNLKHSINATETLV